MRALTAAVAFVVGAGVAAGCGNDVDDAGSSWPRRDVRLLAPADPGGGWDTTARECQHGRVEEGHEGHRAHPREREVCSVSGRAWKEGRI